MASLTPEQKTWRQKQRDRAQLQAQAQAQVEARAKEEAQALALAARDKRRENTISASRAKTEANTQKLAEQKKAKINRHFRILFNINKEGDKARAAAAAEAAAEARALLNRITTILPTIHEEDEDISSEGSSLTEAQVAELAELRDLEIIDAGNEDEEGNEGDAVHEGELGNEGELGIEGEEGNESEAVHEGEVGNEGELRIESSLTDDQLAELLKLEEEYGMSDLNANLHQGILMLRESTIELQQPESQPQSQQESQPESQSRENFTEAIKNIKKYLGLLFQTISSISETKKSIKYMFILKYLPLLKNLKIILPKVQTSIANNSVDIGSGIGVSISPTIQAPPLIEPQPSGEPQPLVALEPSGEPPVLVALEPLSSSISSSLFLLSSILLSTTNRNNLLQLPLLEALTPEAQALARETQTITPEAQALARETQTIIPETRGLAPEALAPETITPEIALTAEIQALAPETITQETITPEIALAPEAQALARETQALASETQPLAPETQPPAPETVSAPETTIVSEIARGREKFIPPFANSTMVGRELSLTSEQRKMVNIIKNNRTLKKVNTLLLTLPIDIQLEFIDILLPIFNKLKFDEKTYFDTSKPLLKLITEIKASAERKQKLLTLPGPVLQPILTPESSRIPTSLFLLSTILLSITNSKSLIAESVEMPVAKYIRTVISPLAPGSLTPGSLAPGSLAQGSLASGSLASGSLAPGSLAPGSETIATVQDIEDNAGSGLRPIIPELSQELINILNSFMKLDPNTVLKDKLQKIDKIIDDNISNIGNLNAELKQFNIIITSNNICINIEK